MDVPTIAVNGRQGDEGGPISPATLTSNWVCACQSAASSVIMAELPIHDLRHSFAVEALRQGYRRVPSRRPRCRGSHAIWGMSLQTYSSLFEVHRTAAHRRQQTIPSRCGCLAVSTRAPASSDRRCRVKIKLPKLLAGLLKVSGRIPPAPARL